MAHFMDQFGPALELPWTKLVDVPELTDEFVAKLAAQSDAQAGGRSIAQLEHARDDILVAVLQGLRAQGAGAGETLAEWERGLRGGAASRDGALDGLPLRLIDRQVPADWIDYNGHVHESRYLQLFADATDGLLRLLGVDGNYLERGSYYTVESHLSHLGQLLAGDRVEVTTQLLGWDDKRLHVFHRLLRDGDPEPVALAEQMLVHVDPAAGRAAPIGEAIRDRIATLSATHAGLPRPDRAGRAIRTIPPQE
jgi:carnitine 3-dehydrogenase